MNSRKSDRVSTKQIVSISQEDVKQEGLMIDISNTGIGFLSKYPLDKNSFVNVSFSMATPLSHYQFDEIGTVIHCAKVRKEYLIGFEFNQLSTTHKHAINDFVFYTHKSKL